MNQRRHGGWLAVLLLAAGCGTNAPARNPQVRTTLQIGIGGGASTSAGDDAGLAAVVSNLTTEPLFFSTSAGRPAPRLAESWSYSPDGLSLTVRLRDGAFHDNSPLTAEFVKTILERRLPRFLGPAFDDISEIRVDGERRLVFVLRRRSNFLLEALDVAIAKPGTTTIGTGPFKVASPGATTQLIANDSYAGGPPAVSQINLKPYESVRTAWAELLRGNVDMLYEVGLDALDSLEPSSGVKVFSYRRHYQFVLLFNTRKPLLRESSIRRELSSAVDRALVITEALGGRGTPSSGPIWPEHWAVPADLTPLPYSPRRLASSDRPLQLVCVVVDPTHERVAIALQRQLRSVGVQLDLQMPGAREAVGRVESGAYDLALLEIASAPNLLRPFLFWSSKGPYNYGGYSNSAVDTALKAIQEAPDDASYAAGVAEFQRGIVEDPPAIFLAWSERARAVSTAFEVPVESGRDPLTTLRLWRPVVMTSTSN